MKITDLSHTICNNMPVYPGTEEPFIEYPYQVEKNGYNEARLRLVSHTGTHIDAPAHMISGGVTLDRMSPDQFFGKGKLIDVRKHRIIEKATIQEALGASAGIDFLLFYTGWSDFWGKEKYFQGYPCLSNDAAQFLSILPWKGIGIDAISFDKEESTEFPVHKMLLQQSIVLLENLTNLGKIASKEFWLMCAPLKFANSDGAPARVISIEEYSFQNSEVK